MAYIEQIENETGDVLATLLGSHEVYIMDDGSEISIPVRPAWCFSCHKFVMVEHFIDPDEYVAEQRRRIDSIGYGSSKTWREGKYEAWLRSFRRTRVASPRCLECAKHDFVLLADQVWMKHPADPSRKIRCRFTVFADMAIAPRRFDLEGIELPRQ